MTDKDRQIYKKGGEKLWLINQQLELIQESNRNAKYRNTTKIQYQSITSETNIKTQAQDLSSNLQHSCKKSGLAAHAHYPSTKRWAPEHPDSLLARELPAQREPDLRRYREEKSSGGKHGVSCSALCSVCTHMGVHANTHTSHNTIKYQNYAKQKYNNPVRKTLQNPNKDWFLPGVYIQ